MLAMRLWVSITRLAIASVLSAINCQNGRYSGISLRLTVLASSFALATKSFNFLMISSVFFEYFIVILPFIFFCEMDERPYLRYNVGVTPI
jgi:hypothetical protein